MITSSNTPLTFSMKTLPAQAPVELQQVTRQKRDTETQNGPGTDPLTRDDGFMAAEVADAIERGTRRSTQGTAAYQDIPLNSTFGQWWVLLAQARDNPALRAWIGEQGGRNLQTLTISPEKGEISFQVSPGGVMRTFGPDDKGWAAVSSPLMEIAKTITAGSSVSSFHPPVPEWLYSAPLSLVKDFYGVPQSLSTQQALEYASVLRRDKKFPDAPPAFSQMRGEDTLSRQRSLLGDHINEYEAKRNIRFVFDFNQTNNLADSSISEYLDGQVFSVHPDSTFPKDKQNHLGQISLKQYLEHHGLEEPTNSHELDNLAAALLTPRPISPLNANYAGALAWPIPLDATSEAHLKTLLRQGKVGDIDLSAHKSVLEYLLGDMKLTQDESLQPRKVINTLIQSPRGRELGNALQAAFEARSVKGSASDWLLAALSIHQADQAPSPGVSPKASIGGRPFAVPEEAGVRAERFVSQLVDGQRNHGHASNNDTARIQTYLLLSSRAPEFLVKDIPDKVTFGSHSWVSFVTAVGRLEAKAPGSTSTMNYAQVMSHATIAPITQAERQVEYLAQQEALMDWGAANGMPYPQTTEQMNTVREAFNAQISELKAASDALSNPMPTGKDLAVKYLKEAMPEMDPALFEKKCISLLPAHVDYEGPYSLIDLYSQGDLILNPPTAGVIDVLLGVEENPRWVSSSKDVIVNEFIGLYANKKLPVLADVFKDTYSHYSTATEKGLASLFKHVISQQPLSTRQIIEEGEVTLLREDKIGWTASSEGTSTAVKPYVKQSENDNPLLKVKHKGRNRFYEIDLKKGALTERFDLKDIEPGKYPRNSVRHDIEYVEIKPRTPENHATDVAHKKTTHAAIPNSFASARTAYLADAVINHIDLPGRQAQAKGITTFDEQSKISEKISEFLLNLIPGRSAVLNFIDGKIVEGILDLGIDALGFVVPMSGAIAKGSKAIASTASVLGKVARLGTLAGRTAVGVLNPLDGVVELLKGGVNLAKNGFKYVSNTGKLDLIAAARNVDASSVGTFKLQGTVIEGPAVLKGGKWHAFDAVSAQPFGKPLDDFVPSMRASTDELGDWATGSIIRTAEQEKIIKTWKDVVNKQRSAANRVAFEAGYALDAPVNISGYSKNMKPLDLMALVSKNPNLTSEQVGSLLKQYDIILYSKGKASVNFFHDSIHPIGTVHGIPQTAYISLTQQFSNGQCSGLSRTMATAAAEGKSAIFIRNLRRAAAFPKDQKSIEFMRTLNELQSKVGGKNTFHANKPARQVTYQNMIKELAEAPGTKSVMIEVPEHAMTAGVSVNGTTRTYYFYDPNLGSAEFSSVKDMEDGLGKLFSHKGLSKDYRSVGTDVKNLEFRISDHDTAWQELFSINRSAFRKLYEAPI